MNKFLVLGLLGDKQWFKHRGVSQVPRICIILESFDSISREIAP